MIMVQMLEADDLIAPLDWCRPLSIVSMSGGHSDYYSFRNQYTGCPENNSEWVRVKCVVGPRWFGHTVKEYNKMSSQYGYPFEFIRGEVPKKHRLNMKGYADLSKSVRKQMEEVDDDIPF